VEDKKAILFQRHIEARHRTSRLSRHHRPKPDTPENISEEEMLNYLEKLNEPEAEVTSHSFASELFAALTLRNRPKSKRKDEEMVEPDRKPDEINEKTNNIDEKLPDQLSTTVPSDLTTTAPGAVPKATIAIPQEQKTTSPTPTSVSVSVSSPVASDVSAKSSAPLAKPVEKKKQSE
jgi:hypothetical protein